MTDAILVINAGSSSIKFAGYAADGAANPRLLAKGALDGIGSDPYFAVKDADGKPLGSHDWPRGSTLSHADAIAFILDWIRERAPGAKLVAAGHRVVFGGADYDRPIRLTPPIIDEIAKLVPFFPLHLPHNLAAIRAVSQLDAKPAADRLLRQRVSSHPAAAGAAPGTAGAPARSRRAPLWLPWPVV